MDKVKGCMIGVVAVINIFVTDYFGVFAPLLYVTLGLMVFDLITRVYAASVREDERAESKKVLLGIKRKIGMCMLIVLSMVLDFGLQQISGNLGITIVSKIMFTALVLAWIFVRELISNLENLQWAGVDLPPFLTKALSIAKDKVDQLGDATVGEDDEHENI